MTLPDWTTREGAQAWNKLRLQDKLLPGVVRVNAKCDSGLDVQKPHAGGKALVVDNGAPPIVFDVEHELTPSEADALRVSHMNLFRPRRVSASREALSAVHPQMLFWNVAAVTVGEVELPTPKAGGNMLLKYQLIEWVPGVKKVKKPANTPKASSGFGDGKDASQLADTLSHDARSRKQFGT